LLQERIAFDIAARPNPFELWLVIAIGGVIKGVYDILLLIKFQKVRPPEEAGAMAN
jgi:hypothetical protein